MEVPVEFVLRGSELVEAHFVLNKDVVVAMHHDSTGDVEQTPEHTQDGTRGASGCLHNINSDFNESH